MELWRIMAWSIVVGAVIMVVAFLVIPPIAWWFYRKHPAYPDQVYRTFWPRFWAGITDALVLVPLALIAQYCLSFDNSFWDTARWLYVVIFIFNYTHAWVYSVYMHGRFGQTVGKLSTCVRVVDVETEGPITFSHALLRDCIPILISVSLLVYESYRMIEGLPFSESITRISSDSSLATSGQMWIALIAQVWWFAEIVTMLTNDKRRAIHDFIAGTVVIRTNIEAEEGD